MREVIHFNTKWAFSKETLDRPEKMPKNWCWVNVPHTWNAIDGTDGGSDYYRGACWYARELDLASLPEADEYWLAFDGVNASADVWVNGQAAGHHDGGYSAWRVNLTEMVHDGTNLIALRVDNSANDRVYPQQADFTFYGGIYRDVKIIAVSHAHLALGVLGASGVAVESKVGERNITTEGKSATAPAEVAVKTYVANPMPGMSLTVELLDADGRVVSFNQEEVDCETADDALLDEWRASEADARAAAAPGTDEAAIHALYAGEDQVTVTASRFGVGQAHLWNGRKDPYLYAVRVTLSDGAGVLDSVTEHFGIRAYRIDPDEGFILNGVKTPLRGVARHQDRDGAGNALTPEMHREDMDIICEMGANTIRLAHYQHSQVFYDLCDERGMAVWAEIPYISSHMNPGDPNTRTQMRELIAQNICHPSIIVWGLSNEITIGTCTDETKENHKVLHAIVRRMDHGREITIACVGTCPIDSPLIDEADVFSYNLYNGWYEGKVDETGPKLDGFHEKRPEKPIGLSEYGADCGMFYGEHPQKGDYTEDYQAWYHEQMITQIRQRPYLWATHVWNMFDFAADARDEGGIPGRNLKGLVSFDRKRRKDAYYAYKAWLSDEPFVRIAGRNYVNREEDQTTIKVYTNQPSVELFVNGESIGVNDKEELFFHFTIPNVGEQEITAVAGSCQDTIMIRKVEELDESYRYKAPGVILNWFDIKERDGYYSLNDQMDKIARDPRGREAVIGILEKLAEPACMMSVGMGFMKEMPDLSSPEARRAVAEGLLKQIGIFSVVRLTGFMAARKLPVGVTKEDLLAFGDKLIEIPKED